MQANQHAVWCLFFFVAINVVGPMWSLVRVSLRSEPEAPHVTQYIYSVPDRSSYTGDTTLVTMYFNLNRAVGYTKHASGLYVDNSNRVLSIATPMVVFTDCCVDDILRWRNESVPTLVVYTNLYEMNATKRFMAKLRSKYTLDKSHLDNIFYTPELFMLYLLKPEFIALVSALNPFNAQRFVYLDIGAIRVPRPDIEHKPWPSLRMQSYLGRDGRIMMQSPAGAKSPCLDIRIMQGCCLQPSDAYSPRAINVSDPMDFPGKGEVINTDFIAGAIFGGTPTEIAKYESLYYGFLDRYLAKKTGPLYLIDQHIMGALACAHPDLIEVVIPEDGTREDMRWFYILDLLI